MKKSEFGIRNSEFPSHSSHSSQSEQPQIAQKDADPSQPFWITRSERRRRGFQPPRIDGSGPAEWQLKTQNSKLKTCFLAAFIVMIGWGAPISAKLAVFVDGRVLKVADARLEGSEIVLELKGGGSLTVPAVRIDRVVADEVEEPKTERLFVDPDCEIGWTADPLPPQLPFRESIAAAAEKTDLHPWLVAAVVQTESAFDPLAVSRAGAAGLMQLMPAAAADHSVRDVFDPVENLRGGTEHLRAMFDRFDSLSLALAAYNAGATTVDRYEGVPPYKETRSYVRRVVELFCPQE